MLVHAQRSGTDTSAENDHVRTSAVGTDHEVVSIREGKQSAVGGRMMFAAGSAELTTPTKEALDQIAQNIRGHRQIVVVKGFASLDDLPEGAGPQLFSKLALERARAAQEYLIERGVDPEILGIYAGSTHEPVRKHTYGTDGQAENRRVEVEVSSSLLEERQDTTSSSPASREIRQDSAGSK
jgi:outer membrane protein OmpA-like peptidoglycan-associated protein